MLLHVCGAVLFRRLAGGLRGCSLGVQQAGGGAVAHPLLPLPLPVLQPGGPPALGAQGREAEAPRRGSLFRRHAVPHIVRGLPFVHK